MTDQQYKKLDEFTYLGTCQVQTPTGLLDVDGCFVINDLSKVQDLAVGETCYWERKNPRDLKLHKAYFTFLNYIWKYLPNKFQMSVPEPLFYLWLKQFSGEYDVKYRFKSPQKAARIFGVLAVRKKNEKWRITYKQLSKICAEFAKEELIEYRSISFSRMDETAFRDYIREQLPKIYEVIHAIFENEQASDIIQTIEKDWERFFDKVFKQ